MPRRKNKPTATCCPKEDGEKWAPFHNMEPFDATKMDEDAFGSTVWVVIEKCSHCGFETHAVQSFDNSLGFELMMRDVQDINIVPLVIEED